MAPHASLYDSFALGCMLCNLYADHKGVKQVLTRCQHVSHHALSELITMIERAIVSGHCETPPGVVRCKHCQVRGGRPEIRGFAAGAA